MATLVLNIDDVQHDLAIQLEFEPGPKTRDQDVLSCATTHPHPRPNALEARLPYLLSIPSRDGKRDGRSLTRSEKRMNCAPLNGRYLQILKARGPHIPTPAVFIRSSLFNSVLLYIGGAYSRNLEQFRVNLYRGTPHRLGGFFTHDFWNQT